ncbi:outer membrane beta-barrel protein [Alsobacter soli]|uniref:outer membrane beta-barrel protein n=1 Tax=Alsobacter soli TaxID=2109933 RepID=UPI001304BE32|nr:outer membrane beta-barrel protein [Alsobacter soli]
MPARPSTVRLAALAGLASGLAWATATLAQEADPFQPPPDPTRPAAGALSTAPATSKPAFRGSYAQVGKPVKGSQKKPKPRRLQQAQTLASSPAPVPLGSTSPVAAALPNPGLPEPEPRRRPRRKAEVDPYEPLGFDTGGLILRPAIEATGGYDTNPNRAPGPHKGSALLRQEGSLQVDSQWERHAFTATLRGAYNEYPGQPSANRPDGQGSANLRLDILRDTQVDLGAAYDLTTERPGSLEQPIATLRRSTILTAGASATLTQRFGAAAVSLRGSVDRTTYGDLQGPDGVDISQPGRDLNAYALRLRTGYEVTPGVQPFVEASVDKRAYDTTIDASGYARSSSGVQARAGSTFEITRTLTGEVSAGYGSRDYEDPRLLPLRGPVADASLVWSATPLTTVTLRGTSALAETTVVGATGATVKTLGIEISHALMRNLILAATGSVYQTDYIGQPLRENGYTAGLKLEYKLTRSVALKASYSHERLNGAVPGSDYTANVVLVGLRLQH